VSTALEVRVKIGEREERVTVAERDGRYRVSIGDSAYMVDAARLGGSATLSLLIDGRSREAEVLAEGSGYRVFLPSRTLAVEVQDEVLARAGRRPRRAEAGGPLALTSPMPGVIVEVRTEPGLAVAPGDPLVIVEAMKMQNELAAVAGGVVREVRVKPGQTVAAGEVLLTLERRS
jgi:biotin carboxyl carrier protein